MQEQLVRFEVEEVSKAEADDFLALYRDEDKLHTYRGSQASKSGIDIYSCAGRPIRRINVCDARSWMELSMWQ